MDRRLPFPYHMFKYCSVLRELLQDERSGSRRKTENNACKQLSVMYVMYRSKFHNKHLDEMLKHQTYFDMSSSVLVH